MGLFIQLPKDYPVINDDYIDSIQDKLWECACETFSGTDSFYEGAWFAEDGPSLKELTEHAVENYDDGKLEYWQNYNYTDGIKCHYESAKYVFNESGVKYGSQVTGNTAEQYNDAIRMIVSGYEWTMAENMYEYLTKKYPSFGMIDDVMKVVEDYDTFNECNSGNWRHKYLDSDDWSLTYDEDGYENCDVCSEWNDDVDKTPHFVNKDDKLYQKTGCRHTVCAVCGDGS